MNKNKEDVIIDEILDAYAEDLYEADLEEYAHLFEEDEQYLANKHLMENVEYKKTEKRKIHLTKYIAAAAAVLLIITVTIPTTEASAWRIWDLDFWFGEHEDHTEIRPNDTDIFPQFVVAELINGFEIAFENIDETGVFIQYQNDNGEYLIYSQIPKSQFTSQLDNENHGVEKQLIGDFEVAVSDGSKDTIYEVVTDEVAIFIQSNADEDIVKTFLLNLKEN